MQLIFDARASPINIAGRDPTIDATAIVADLELIASAGFNNMEILSSVDLAKNDVSNLKLICSIGSTVQSWPESILPFIECPRGRNCVVSPFCNLEMYGVAQLIISDWRRMHFSIV